MNNFRKINIFHLCNVFIFLSFKIIMNMYCYLIIFTKNYNKYVFNIWLRHSIYEIDIYILTHIIYNLSENCRLFTE